MVTNNESGTGGSISKKLKINGHFLMSKMYTYEILLQLNANTETF